MQDEVPELGLVLTGGGARAAYQVGVLKGIAELLWRGSSCPFQVITGTSAGAVSAVALASDPAHFRHAVYAIERVWRDFRVHHVIKADALRPCSSPVCTGCWRCSRGAGWCIRRCRCSTTARYGSCCRKNLNFDGIPRSLYKKHLQAIGICATSYTDADSVTFYNSASPIEPWTRASRKGARVHLTLNHLMASLSMPFLFRPILLHQQYYGDGAMRQTSPLSPALHLGANRLLVIGVGDPSVAGLGMRNPDAAPTFGQMFGFMLDSLFMDQLHSDLERISHYNEDSKARRIDCLVLTPSQDLSEIARRHRHELPRSSARVAADHGREQQRRHATAELPACSSAAIRAS